MRKAHEGGHGRGGPGPRRGRRGGRRGHGPPPQVREAVDNYWNQYVPTDAGCDGKVFNGAEDLQAFIQNMATQVQGYIEQNYPEGSGPGNNTASQLSDGGGGGFPPQEIEAHKPTVFTKPNMTEVSPCLYEIR